jgi:hypothetical protein
VEEVERIGSALELGRRVENLQQEVARAVRNSGELQSSETEQRQRKKRKGISRGLV